MFQMNCAECSGLIKSEQLSQVQVIACPHCREVVPIRNVVVSPKSLSLDVRASLKKALVSARDNFRLSRSQALEAPSHYEINKRLGRFLRRDDFRLDMSDALYVQVNYDNRQRQARLLNISSTGAGIEFVDRGQVPEDLAEFRRHFPDDSAAVNCQLPLTDETEPLSVPGRVVWCKIPAAGTLFPAIEMGVQFEALDEETRSRLWEFIVTTDTPTTP